MLRLVGLLLIAVMLLASVARAAEGAQGRAVCGGAVIAADVCHAPGLPPKTARSAVPSCCAALPDLTLPAPVSGPSVARAPLQRIDARLLPDRAARAGPWRPPRG